MLLKRGWRWGLEMDHIPLRTLDGALQTLITPAYCLKVLGLPLGRRTGIRSGLLSNSGSNVAVQGPELCRASHPSFFLKLYSLIRGKLLYKVVLVSAIHIPSPLSLPAPLGHHRVQAGLPVLYGNFSPAIYFTHRTVYVSMLLSPFVPLAPSHTVSTGPFSISVSPFLPCK